MFVYDIMSHVIYVDWLIDLIYLQRVWALTVSMHLGLIDGPFVPHNLISGQKSPVPSPKFQMTPRLKILMSSGSKKGTQMYYPFLSKVPASQSPLGSPVESPRRDMPVSRAYLNISSRVPSKKALSKGPPQRLSALSLFCHLRILK